MMSRRFEQKRPGGDFPDFQSFEFD
jgi:hypothetical protein